MVKWMGLDKWSGELGLEEESVFQVDALFPNPGVYDIHNWRLAVTLLLPGSSSREEDENAGHFVQMPESPMFVTVV